MQKIIQTPIFQGPYYLHFVEREIIELTSFGCLYTLASMGKAVPLIRRYAAEQAAESAVSGC